MPRARQGDHESVKDPSELARFVDAQDGGGTFAGAVSELRAGRKLSHRMWFAFPQIAGLGKSTMAQRYAILGQPEAQAFRAHPELGPGLCSALASWPICPRRTRSPSLA